MKIINLLPKIKQQELHYEELFHSFSRAAMIAGAMLLLLLVLQLGERVYLSQEATTIAAKTEATKKLINKQENNDLKAKIKLINAQMADYKTLADTTPSWSKVLTAFAEQVPDTVKINSFTADVATKKITISGQSPTRELVIALFNNINADKKDFHDIDYPLENVAQPLDVAFHYSFFIQDDLLKP